MKVLISGGSGLVGRALAESLQADGHAVWILSRDPSSERMPAGASGAAWDGQTTAGWGELMEQMDAVAHLAGENTGTVPWSPRRKAQIRESRVKTGRALVEAIRKSSRKPGAFFQISGSGYYGTSESATFTEDSPRGSDFMAGVSLDWEGATQPVEEMGVRRVVARSAPVLDAKEGILPRIQLPFKMMVGGPLGSGRQWYSWIHITDQVRGIRFLLENPQASGAFNLCAPNPLRNADFERVVGKVMGRPAWFTTPAFGLRAVLGEMSMLVLEGQRMLPKRLLEMGFRFQFEHLEQALEDLNGKDGYKKNNHEYHKRTNDTNKA